MIGRNDLCWCKSGKKWKKCHFPVPPPEENLSIDEQKARYLKRYGIIIKTSEQIAGIRRSCKLAAKILAQTCEMAKNGVSTQELNDFAHKLHIEHGAKAAPLHYGTPPFPKSICTSINDVICHGIPGPEILKDGDIVNIDVTCILDGFYGDCSCMVQIGTVSPDKKLVCDVAYESLMRAISILKPGIAICEIGNTISQYSEAHGCSVVTQFIGHGVGLEFHEPPQIPHYRNSMEIQLIPGMIFTIEPMINAGSHQAVVDRNDRWTARTIDGKPSAQWEHTVLITETGHEILTIL